MMHPEDVRSRMPASVAQLLHRVMAIFRWMPVPQVSSRPRNGSALRKTAYGCHQQRQSATFATPKPYRLATCQGRKIMTQRPALSSENQDNGSASQPRLQTMRLRHIRGWHRSAADARACKGGCALAAQHPMPRTLSRCPAGGCPTAAPRRSRMCRSRRLRMLRAASAANST